MAATVYLETTIPSYLAAKPSRDLIVAAHQQLTLDRWQTRRTAFELYVSELVLQESRLGDADFAARRLSQLAGIPSLAVTPEARSLAGTLVTSRLLPAKASADALHIHRRDQRRRLSSYLEHSSPRKCVHASSN